MEPEMFTLFPGGIRALLVDDDVRFLKAASMLLTLLNFKVSTCGSHTSALKMLTTDDKYKSIDVILTDAQKAATCGFDFRAIVEPDLRVPVLYFLSMRHKSVGAEADALLRTLELATFILKKPLDADDACNLWRVIAWRKCCLEVKAAAGAAVNEGQSSCGGDVRPHWARSSVDNDGEEEDRVHFKVINGVRGRKRKSSKNPDSSSGSSVPARRRGRPAKRREMDVAAQETDHLAKPVPRKNRSKKAKTNCGSVSVPELPETMNGEPQPPQPRQSLFVQSVLQTLDVPPYNPSIFVDAVEPGSNIISFSSGSNTTAAAPAQSPVFSAPASPPVYQAPAAPEPLPVYQAPTAPEPSPVYQAPAAPEPSPVYRAPAAPAPPPVYQAPAPPEPSPVYQAPATPSPPPVYQAPTAPAPAAVYPAPAPAPAVPPMHEQQQPASGNVFGNIAPPATATTMAPALTYEQETALPQLLSGAFGPFPYQGPLPPVVQQDILAPPGSGVPQSEFATRNIQLLFQQPPIAAGDPFTGMVGGDAFGAANAAHPGNSGHTASSLMQSLNHGAAQLDDELAAMMAMYTTGDPPLAPQHIDLASMYYSNNSTAVYYNNNAESFMAPHQVLGMAYGANNPAMVDGAFDGSAASFMAPQDFGVALQDFGVAPLGFGEAPNVNNQVGMGEDLAPMVASDGNEENYSFPLEALLGMDVQMYDASLAGQQGGASDGAGPTVANAAGAYLNGGEGGMDNWGMGPVDGLGSINNMLMNNPEGFLFPDYMNNGRE